ncbi:hypothetical protein NIES2109_50020 [Nostoc sp. HK-01]|uniref:Uncharacterized protein n=1 Tax=Nostoc cycadae WK-1 TaxID=1861711 RepID=A0A2H6LHM9_9NOSO|nr:DUF4328 domain-containing protein [Nostoc cycadae]BBD62164.1 hypothetical protein NIES2109_50020 [Nostoc sp. HK-01]GBE92718.1 hypothetical protein NCWK1_2476 [Nostoc cycadae WK-1]
MSNFNAGSSLKSAAIGKFLVRLLWVLIGIGVISTFFSLLAVIAQPIYQIFASIDGLISIVSLLIGVISIIIFLVWLHRIHTDLKNLFQEYPITPGGAIARFMIPIYSLWGISHTLSTFAEKFQAEGGDLTSLSERVRSLIAPLYCFMIGSRALNRIVFEASKNPGDKFLPVWFLVSCFVDLGFTVVLLQLTKTMGTAVTQKAKRNII